MTTQNQRASRKQEGRITKSLKQLGEEARTQMASGAMWFAKSDVVSKLFRIEAKTKAKPGAKQITVKQEVLDKIREEAVETGKIAALAFSIDGKRDYFAIEDREFYTLVEELLMYRSMFNFNDGDWWLGSFEDFLGWLSSEQRKCVPRGPCVQDMATTSGVRGLMGKYKDFQDAYAAYVESRKGYENDTAKAKGIDYRV